MFVKDGGFEAKRGEQNTCLQTVGPIGMLSGGYAWLTEGINADL